MLSMKTQYAFKALMYLAQKNTSSPVLIAEIADKKNIQVGFGYETISQIKFGCVFYSLHDKLKLFHFC